MHGSFIRWSKLIKQNFRIWQGGGGAVSRQSGQNMEGYGIIGRKIFPLFSNFQGFLRILGREESKSFSQINGKIGLQRVKLNGI